MDIVKKSKKTINILSMCGGGVRGIIPLRFLVEIEKHLTEQKTSIREMFDIVVASSISSVLICALLLIDNDKLKYKAEDLFEIYKKNAVEIFSDGYGYKLWSGYGWLGPKYSGTNWHNFLKNIFQDAKLGDLDKFVIIPAIDTEAHSYIYFDSRNVLYKDMYLYDILAGATAAPTYFPSHKFTHNDIEYCLVDGGLSLNNPSILSYLKAKQHWGNNVEYLQLSLGTGYSDLPKSLPTWGLLKWLSCLIDYMIHHANINQEHNMSLVMNDDNYLNINPKIPTEKDCLDRSDLLDDYVQIAEDWIKENEDIIVTFTTKLLIQRNFDDIDITDICKGY